MAIFREKLVAIVGADTSGFTREMRGMRSTLGGVTAMFRKWSIRAGIAVVGLSTAATAMNLAWRKKLSEVRTLLGQNEEDFQSWADSIVRTAKDMGIRLGDATEAAYQTISGSAKFTTTAAEGQELLAKNAKLAVAGFTDLAAVTSVTTQILSTYGLSVDEIDDINNLLFKGMTKGRFRIEEMQGSLAFVTGTAKTLSIDIFEVVAALTTMTRAGTPFNRATRQLNILLTGILDPASEAAQAMEDYGINLSRADVRTGSFAATMQTVSEQFIQINKDIKSGKRFSIETLDIMEREEELAKLIVKAEREVRRERERLQDVGINRTAIRDREQTMRALQRARAEQTKQLKFHRQVARLRKDEVVSFRDVAKREARRRKILPGAPSSVEMRELEATAAEKVRSLERDLGNQRRAEQISLKKIAKSRSRITEDVGDAEEHLADLREEQTALTKQREKEIASAKSLGLEYATVVESSRGLLAAFALMDEGALDFVKTEKELRENLGELDKAFTELQEQPEKQLADALNELTIVWTEMGETALPIVREITSLIKTQLIPAIEDLGRVLDNQAEAASAFWDRLLNPKEGDFTHFLLTPKRWAEAAIDAFRHGEPVERPGGPPRRLPGESLKALKDLGIVGTLKLGAATTFENAVEEFKRSVLLWSEERINPERTALIVPERRQHGGIIRGRGFGDTVPAMLSPGEFVINRRSTALFAPLLRAINQGPNATAQAVAGAIPMSGSGGNTFIFRAPVDRQTIRGLLIPEAERAERLKRTKGQERRLPRKW